jgi:aminoglycoside phosphotransferase (APT) family kinase protein
MGNARPVELLAPVPEQHRDDVRDALEAAIGFASVSSVRVMAGGASGALTFRVEARHDDLVLRIESIRGPLRNPHQYECMRVAAEAGVAPPIRYLDDEKGILLLPYIEQRPPADFPGGAAALASAGGELLARLHAAPGFPARSDYFEDLARLVERLERSGRVRAGLLDTHRDGLRQLRDAYPWHPEKFVSAHNDPNQFNMLFDGQRLWLIDWETARRNDPFVDIATLCSHVAPHSELRDVVLRAALGRSPEALDHAPPDVDVTGGAALRRRDPAHHRS